MESDFRSAQISVASTPFSKSEDMLIGSDIPWFSELVGLTTGIDYSTTYNQENLFEAGGLEIHPWEPGGWADPNSTAIWNFPNPNQFNIPNYDPYQFNIPSYDPYRFEIPDFTYQP